MDSEYVCIGELIAAYLDSGADKYGISLDEWEKDQVICTYCSDRKGEPLCPGAIYKATRK